MAFSTQRAVSNGTLQVLLLSIEYIDKSDITVYVNSIETTAYTWASDTSIRFNSVVPNGQEVLIRRTTDMANIRHKFTTGAQFKASTLDEDFQQILHISQEALEGGTVRDLFNVLNMHGYKISNLGKATADGDAVSLGQVKTESAGAWTAAAAAQAARDVAIQRSKDADASATSAFVSKNAAAASATAAASSATSSSQSAASAGAQATAAARSASEAKLDAKTAVAAGDAAIDAAARAIEAKASAKGSADAAAASAGKAQAAEVATVTAKDEALEAAGRFLPPSATAPTTRVDGSPLQNGDFYLNLLAGVEYFFYKGNWVSNNLDGTALSDRTNPAKGSALVGTRMPDKSLLGLAIGRALQDKLYDTISIKDFVILGDEVVTTPETGDWSPVIQRAFDWAQKAVVGRIRGVSIHFPAGEYQMSYKAKCDLAPTGTRDTGAVGIRLIGDGTAQTSFVARPENTTGCIHLTSGRNLEVFEVRSVSFLSNLDMDAATNNGVALTIDSALKRGDVGYGDQPRWSCVVDDIYVGGYGRNAGHIARRGNWVKGIYIADKYHPRLSNIRALSRYGGNIETRTACTHGVHMHACYSPSLDTMYVHGGWEHGIWIDDLYNAPGGFEDFRLINSFVAGCDHGVGIVHDNDTAPSSQLTEPGGLISGLHCNARKNGITIRNHQQVIINGLYAYAAREDRRGDEKLPSCILLQNASNISISAQFHEPGFFNSNEDATVAVRIERASECITVDAQFGHGGIGVLNNSTATLRKTIVVNAKLTTSRRLVAVWAPLTVLVDNAGTATLYNNVLGNSQDVFEFASGKPNAGTYPAALRARSLVPGNNFGGALELSGTAMDGSTKHWAILRSRLMNSTLGSEETSMGVFIQKEGIVSEVMRVQVPSGANDTYMYLLTNVDGAPTLKRVKLGKVNSGGTGLRALCVDN